MLGICGHYVRVYTLYTTDEEKVNQIKQMCECVRVNHVYQNGQFKNVLRIHEFYDHSHARRVRLGSLRADMNRKKIGKFSDEEFNICVV